jgi:hypothetical protein
VRPASTKLSVTPKFRTTNQTSPVTMPKSKRAKVTTLSKTPIRSTKASKTSLVNEVRTQLDHYDHAWLFSVGDMRNEGLKQVRAQWRGTGRFFFGKGKVMTKALGDSPEVEYQDGLSPLAKASLPSRMVDYLLTKSRGFEDRSASFSPPILWTTPSSGLRRGPNLNTHVWAASLRGISPCQQVSLDS